MQLLVQLLTAGGELAECWSSENGPLADPRIVGTRGSRSQDATNAEKIQNFDQKSSLCPPGRT